MLPPAYSLPTIRPMCTSDLESRWEAEAQSALAQSLRGKRSSHLAQKLDLDPNLRFSLSLVDLRRGVSASMSACASEDRRRLLLKRAVTPVTGLQHNTRPGSRLPSRGIPSTQMNSSHRL